MAVPGAKSCCEMPKDWSSYQWVHPRPQAQTRLSFFPMYSTRESMYPNCCVCLVGDESVTDCFLNSLNSSSEVLSLTYIMYNVWHNGTDNKTQKSA